MASMRDIDLSDPNSCIPRRSAPSRLPTTLEPENGMPERYYTINLNTSTTALKNNKYNSNTNNEPTTDRTPNENTNPPRISLRGGALPKLKIVKWRFDLKRITDPLPSLVYKCKREFVGTMFTLRLAQIGAAIAAGVYWIFISQDVSAYRASLGLGSNPDMVTDVAPISRAPVANVVVPTDKMPGWILKGYYYPGHGDTGDGRGDDDVVVVVRDSDGDDDGDGGNEGEAPHSTITPSEQVWSTTTTTEIVLATDLVDQETITTIVTISSNGQPLRDSDQGESIDSEVPSKSTIDDTPETDTNTTPTSSESPEITDPLESDNSLTSDSEPANTQSSSTQSSSPPGDTNRSEEPFAYLPTMAFPAGWLITAAFMSLALLIIHLMLGFAPRCHIWTAIPDLFGTAFWALYITSLLKLGSSLSPITTTTSPPTPSLHILAPAAVAELGEGADHGERANLFATSPYNLTSALVATAFVACFFALALILDLLYLAALISDRAGWTTKSPQSTQPHLPSHSGSWSPSGPRADRQRQRHISEHPLRPLPLRPYYDDGAQAHPRGGEMGGYQQEQQQYQQPQQPQQPQQQYNNQHGGEEDIGSHSAYLMRTRLTTPGPSDSISQVGPPGGGGVVVGGTGLPYTYDPGSNLPNPPYPGNHNHNIPTIVPPIVPTIDPTIYPTEQVGERRRTNPSHQSPATPSSIYTNDMLHNGYPSSPPSAPSPLSPPYPSSPHQGQDYPTYHAQNANPKGRSLTDPTHPSVPGDISQAENSHQPSQEAGVWGQEARQ